MGVVLVARMTRGESAASKRLVVFRLRDEGVGCSPGVGGLTMAEPSSMAPASSASDARAARPL